MSTTDPPAATGRSRAWLPVLRPYLWWAILVLILYGIRTHQRLSEQTRISFTVNLEDKPAGYDAVATLDDQPVTSGQRVSLGSHRFEISHPKAEPVSTNLFIWYGEHNLGAIRLRRTRGLLVLHVEPPAKRLSVAGPEFSVALTDSAGVTSSIPTDAYQVEAHWSNHEEVRRVSINSGQTVSLQLVPPLGALTLESDPSGAIVVKSDGRMLGTTPLTVCEMSPGRWKGELRLDGYIPVALALTITGGETNSVRTNLVNWQYSQAMETARTAFAAGEYDRTVETLRAALKAKPDDPDATALARQAGVAGHLRRAEDMMAKQDYTAARSEAQSVLEIASDNARALALLQDLDTRERENRRRAEGEAEARRQERLALPRKTFDSILARKPDASLFDEHELQAALPVNQVQNALLRELERPPAFTVARISGMSPGAFALLASQEVPGGRRSCVIAGAQTGEIETHIFFKVMEYKSKSSLSFQDQLTITKSYVPLDPSRVSELSEREKTQIRDGAQRVEERIRRAVGLKSQ